MNPETDHEKLENMSNKVDEMYPIVMEVKSFLDGSTTGYKIVRNVVGFLASLFVAIYVVWRVLRGQSPF